MPKKTGFSIRRKFYFINYWNNNKKQSRIFTILLVRISLKTVLRWNPQMSPATFWVQSPFSTKSIAASLRSLTLPESKRATGMYFQKTVWIIVLSCLSRSFIIWKPLYFPVLIVMETMIPETFEKAREKWIFLL